MNQAIDATGQAAGGSKNGPVGSLARTRGKSLPLNAVRMQEQETLQKVIDEIKSDKLSYRQAEARYEINKSKLQRLVSGQQSIDARSGPGTKLQRAPTAGLQRRPRRAIKVPLRFQHGSNPKGDTDSAAEEQDTTASEASEADCSDSE